MQKKYLVPKCVKIWVKVSLWWTNPIWNSSQLNIEVQLSKTATLKSLGNAGLFIPLFAWILCIALHFWRPYLGLVIVQKLLKNAPKCNKRACGDGMWQLSLILTKRFLTKVISTKFYGTETSGKQKKSYRQAEKSYRQAEKSYRQAEKKLPASRKKLPALKSWERIPHPQFGANGSRETRFLRSFLSW